MDIDSWLADKQSSAAPTPTQETQCPPCPQCPQVAQPMKNLRITPEQLFYDVAHDGMVIDEERAKSEPCKFVRLDSGRDIYWVPGVMGIMTKDQAKKYCTDAEEMRLPKKTGKMIETFEIASAECKVGKPFNGGKIDNVSDRLKCMYSVAGGEL